MLSPSILGLGNSLTRIQAPTYGSTQPKESSRSGQQDVRAQATSEDFGYSSFDPDREEYRQPEVPVSSAEVPLTEQPNLGEIIGRKVDAPVPTVQQRRYSAEWDPIRWVLNFFRAFDQFTHGQ